MRIWPAIDLRGGQCVRLQQGDFNRETVFGADPAAFARHLVDQGAECLHLVDLDGAREGRPVNGASVRAILAAVKVPCEFGGGVRDDQTIDELLSWGLAQLVIGTKALTEPAWFRAACRRHPGKLALGIDARDGHVATHGWLNTSSVSAVELATEMAAEPLAAIICTDIDTDGMLGGPNLAAMRAMREAVNVPLVASGGVTTVDDIDRLAQIGLDGCIIGRALYDGRISLPDALEAARRTHAS